LLEAELLETLSKVFFQTCLACFWP
jgi:hypothetical protein